MKRIKLIAGVCLVLQSISFFILFICYLGKKKSLAASFAAVSALSGGAGAYLLYKERREYLEENDEFFNELNDDDDFFENTFDEDEVFCDFEKEDNKDKEEPKE